MRITEQPSTGDAQNESYNVYTLLEQVGITEHMGGVAATHRLLAFCRLPPGRSVLEIGCGTGYTAYLLAKRYQAQVTATDISPQLLVQAARRVQREGAGDRVTLQTVDAHSLPFPNASFDAALAESVLVFCDAGRVTAEVLRVLRPGGVFGFNELTYLKPPPAELRALLASAFGRTLRPRLASEWVDLLRDTGFATASAATYRINLLQQVYSHLLVDGPRRYGAALWRGVADPRIRSAFFTRAMLRAWPRFLPYVGYGLYVGVKA